MVSDFPRYGMRVCADCEVAWPEDRFNATSGSCFRCRTRTLRFGFAGGKDYFKGPTIKERQERQIAEAKANGIEAMPAWHRTYTGGTGGSMSKLAKATESKVAS